MTRFSKANKQKSTVDWMTKLAAVPEWAREHIDLQEEIQLIWFADATMQLHHAFRDTVVIRVSSPMAADWIAGRHLDDCLRAAKARYGKVTRVVIMPHGATGKQEDAYLSQSYYPKTLLPQSAEVTAGLPAPSEGMDSGE